MNGQGKSVVIVGGGIVGIASAHYLQQAGWQVTLIDQAEIGKGSSHANCGFISPSHAAPLCVPGAVWKTLKTMRKKNSPLYIKPRFDPRLFSFLWTFCRKCNHDDMMATTAARLQLLNSSMELYQQLMETEPLQCEWQHKGRLFVYRTAAAFEHFAEEEQLIRENFGLGARRLSGQELVELEPALKPGLAGAWYYESDAHLKPDVLIASWRALLEQRGVVVREQCGLQSLVTQNGKAVAAKTTQGEIAADEFVIATGAWAPLLERELGCKIPIQPGKGLSITMAQPEVCPRIPMMFNEDKVGVTPFNSTYRLGSTMEFGGYDTTLNRQRLALLKKGAELYLHQPYADPVYEEWYGWRPMTSDGRPIIDRSPRCANVFLAVGHNMLGLSMAPATGKVVTEVLGGETPHIDLKPYSLSRF